MQYNLTNQPNYEPQRKCECAVCGEPSTKRHYGVVCCQGCKGFFRRQVRKGSVSSCRYNNSCSITKNERNNCKSCRLRKCLNVGMKIEAVCMDKATAVTNKSPSSLGELSISDSPSDYNQRIVRPTTKSPVSFQNEFNNVANDKCVLPNGNNNPFMSINHITNSSYDYSQSKPSNTLNQYPTTPQYPNFLSETAYYPDVNDPNKPNQFLSIYEINLMQILDNHISNFIKWVKLIPLFNQLSENDKMTLLRDRTADCAMLGLAYRTYAHGYRNLYSTDGKIANVGNYLLFPNNVVITMYTPFIRLRSFIVHVNKNLVEQMNEYKFNSIDLMCLRLIILLTPNQSDDLENPNQVYSIRDHLIYRYEHFIENNKSLNGIVDDCLVAIQPSPYIQNDLDKNASVGNKFSKTISMLFNLVNISSKLVDEAVAFHQLLPVLVLPSIFTYIFKDSRSKIKKLLDMSAICNMSQSTFNPPQDQTNTTPNYNIDMPNNYINPQESQNLINTLQNIDICQFGEYTNFQFMNLNNMFSNMNSNNGSNIHHPSTSFPKNNANDTTGRGTYEK